MNFKSDAAVRQCVHAVLSGDVPVVVDGPQLLRSRRREAAKFCVCVSTPDADSQHYLSEARDAVEFYEASAAKGAACDIYEG